MALEGDLGMWAQIGSLVVETLIVVLLAKTVKDYAQVAKVSKLQTELRFRPWIGPTTGIELLRTVDSKHQYAVTIKNFGEIPATNVIATSTIRHNTMPKREDLLADTKNDLDKFVLGPLLPNMEKKYWIFVDSKDIQNTKEGAPNLFVFVHFTYEYHGGKSGYGMISQFDAKSGLFVHKDMWVD